MILGYLILRGPLPRFRLEVTAFWQIFHFGKWLFISTIITFFAFQLDKFTFAARFPLDVVGLYAIAVGLTTLAPNLLGRLQFSVAFPLYSRANECVTDLASAFSVVSRVILPVGALIVAGLIGVSEAFFLYFYDERYAYAAVLMPLLALGAWFVVVQELYAAVFLSLGRVVWIVWSNLTKVLVFLGLFLLIGSNSTILIGAAIVMLADLSKAVVALVLGQRISLRQFRLVALFTVYLMFVGFSVSWLGKWLRDHTDIDLLVAIFLQGFLVVLLFGPWIVGIVQFFVRWRSDNVNTLLNEA